MFVKCIPHKYHFYVVKLGYAGVYYSLIIASKHRLWVLVRIAGEAVLTCTHSLCFKQKNKENIKSFQLKIIIFHRFKK